MGGSGTGGLGRSVRRLAACALIVVAGPLALGSVASANCLATLHARPLAVPPGGTVTLWGTNYSEVAGAIQIRLDRRNGPVIGSIPAQRTLVDVPFTIPPGTAPGTHTLVATQFNAAGEQVTCGPGRATVVVGTGARTTSDGSLAGAAAPRPDDSAPRPAPAPGGRTEPGVAAPDVALDEAVAAVAAVVALAVLGIARLQRGRILPATRDLRPASG